MLIKRSLQTKTVLVFAVMSIAAGCGQNANIAAKDAAPTTSQLNKAEPLPRGGIIEPHTGMDPKFMQPAVQPQPQPPIVIVAKAPVSAPTPKLPEVLEPCPAYQPLPPAPKKIPVVTVTATPAPQPEPVVTVTVTPKPAPAPKKEPLVAVAIPAPAPSVVPATILEPCPVGYSMAASKVCVYNGKDGKDGKNGKDGKDGVTVIGEKGRDGCGEIEIPAIKFDAVKLEASEFKTSELPYMSKKKHPIKVLQLGQSNRRKKGESYVEDAQVLFKFALRLPPRNAIVKLHALRIRLAVTKVSEDAFPDTEWLCFLDQKVCSGKVYDEKTQKSWQSNLNHDFWNNLSNDFKSNDQFVTQLKGDKVGKFNGMTLWKSDSFELDVAAFIKDSKYPDLLSFIYEGADPTKPLVRELRMAVADDTMVTNATFTLEYMENTCTTFDLQKAAPAPRGTK